MDILIKNMEIPNSCIDPKTSHGCFCLLHCKVGRQRVNDGKSLSGRPSDCPLSPVTHCKDCDNFDEETHLCIRWGSWTSEDGFCHKAFGVLEANK